MIRVALAELRQDPRIWAGPVLVAAVATAFVYLAAAYWWTLGTPSGAALIEDFGSTVAEARRGSYLVYVTTALPAIVVLGTSSAATVAALSSRIARWRLAGATPAQVRGAVTVQVLLVSAVGAVVGVLAATPFRQPAVDVLVRIVTREEHTIPVANPLPAALLALVAAMLVCGFATFAPARRAARIPAVQAIRDSSEPARAMPVSRWIVAGVLLLALVPMIVTALGSVQTSNAGGADVSGAATLAMMTGVILLAVIAALAPVLVPPLTRLWLTIVPARIAPSWFLARSSATAYPRRTATAVIPTSVGLGLYGVLFGIIATWQNALARSGSTEALNTLDTTVILAPAAAITIAGSIASILITSRTRIGEAATIRIAGGAPRTLISLAIAETSGYAGTSIAIAVGVSAATTTIAAAMLTAGGLPTQPVIDLRHLLILGGIAALVLLVVLLLPMATAVRTSLRDSIAGF